MNLKKKLRKFFAMARRDDGFTLVELVVVIAILGVLAGVGTVGYSGYVKKANIQADMSLVSEIKNALMLAYYANPDEFDGAVVMLSSGDEPEVKGDAEKALDAAFGEGWEAREDMKLKYTGWSETFQDSNFYHEEEGLIELLGTVDKLTDALGGFFW